MRELKDEDAMPTGNEGEYVQIMLHILVDGFLEVTVDEHRFATPRPANHLLILFKDCRERKSWTLEIGTAKLELNSGCSYQFDVRQHGMCDVTQQPLARTVADTWPEEVHVQYRERLFTSLPLGLPPVGGREQGGWHPPDAEECWQYVGRNRIAPLVPAWKNRIVGPVVRAPQLLARDLMTILRSPFSV